MDYSMPVDQGTRNPVSEETQNISSQYQEVEKCYHPPFPKPSSRILLLTTSRDLPPYLPLFVGRYAATPLLNLTCANFYKCKLRTQQKVAQCEFVQLFLNALVVSKAWYSHVELSTGFGEMKGNNEGNVFARSRAVLGINQWFAEIRLFPKTTKYENLIRKVELVSFEETVESLIHEMVHAYIQMFVCQRPQCARNLLNTEGLIGHGSTFMKLHGLIVEIVRTWHPSLEYVERERCHPGTSFDMISHSVEERAIEAYKKTGKHEGYLPLRSDSPKTLIRIVKEDLPNGDCFFHVVYSDPQQQIDPDAEYVDDENDGGYDDSEEYEEDEDDEMNDLWEATDGYGSVWRGSISAFVNGVGRCELCIRKEMEVSGFLGLL
ncbi:hypothetical protein CMEL01_04207 [Colletotrichum melonis]|uniref:SprT-like domain-containing protein n=1 Tax=Colletotrichum melonis TaxID=1209925 RepID=A0AAI9UDV0_9PEZI|nr:hypothetical protein CMEL01_04207 [Colletotrichum melonis]